ncbi:E3 ubiquitin-protein ligase SHPRH [Strongylocentrotus purpuratus]|uniref:E3 ubiquitin-protein ligase SHPRH n=1 Tax=Strongylocentrotus purpuratus TaxID=7668 RepID=A0A7M7PEF2_STRPU|nr:E3 ubiquitin-protein ligase SHPRH [Strongylocentrotus purpuratus]
MRQKRKPSSTQQLDPDKRQCLSWDMYDAVNSGSSEAGPSTSQTDEGIEPDVDLCVIDLIEDGPHEVPDSSSDEEVIDLTGDDDLQELALYVDPILEDVVHTEPNDVLYQFKVSKSKYLILERAADYRVKVHLDQPSERDRVGLLCTLKMRLLPVAPAIVSQPNPQLPTDGCSTLLLREAPGYDFLVFPDQQINSLSRLQFSRKDLLLGRGSLLAFSIEMERRPSTSCLESFQELARLYQGKLLWLCLRDYDPASGCASMDAWLLSGIVSQPALNGAQFPSRKQYLEYVPHLMNWYHGFPLPARKKYKAHKRYDYTALFDKVRQYHQTQEVVETISVQHPILVPTLRPYQRDAVCWMVKKEKVKQNEKGQLHILWRLFKTVDDKTLYYNPNSGEITDRRQEMPEAFPGGILADEMGLGKTVEVLAMVLAHPRWVKDHSQDTAISSCTQDKLPDGAVSKDHSQMNMDTSSCTQNKLPNSAVSKDHSLNMDTSSSTQDKLPESAGTDVATPAEGEQLECKTSGTLVSSKNVTMPEAQSDVEVEVSDISDFNRINGSGFQGGTGTMVAGDSMSSVLVHGTAMESNETETVLDKKPVNLLGQEVSEGSSSCTSQNNENITCNRKEETMSLIQVHGTEMKNTAVKVESRTESERNLKNVVEQEPQDNKSLSGPDVQYASQATKQSNSTAQNSKDKDSFHLQGKEVKYLKVTEDEEAPPGANESHMESAIENEKEATQEREKPKVFQCTCGRNERNICQPTCVQCLRCRSWLHAACIGFDIHMPDTPSQDLQFWCPNCFPKVPPLVSGATLIISPASICHQWVDEINRHINSSTLKVVVYEGVKKQGYVQPRTLAECDIVITTYNTLRVELDYANLSQPGTEGRSLRHGKRYQTTPSPLPCVEWWRICLDEAQMIESTTAKSAKMANRLSARNRWCVTGTPIQKSLDDLYGLFLFLGVEPYWVKDWWDLLLSIPYSQGNREPLQKALCKIFWRSAKRDVIDQIALPPQREEIHWLDFSPVETYFYKRKHEECSINFTSNSRKTSVLPETKLSTLDRQSLQSLLGPLLRVRQACCHPHVVRGEFTTLQKKKQLSMEDLLKTMIAKAEVESDGAHRQLVCAMNALAAVHCIKNELPEAVALYREALKSAEEHKDHIKTDKLQMMHAIHNLNEILKDRPEVVEPSPEDGDLAQRMVFLRDQYLQKTAYLVTSSLYTLQPIRDKVLEQQEKIPPGPAWYLDGIQWAIYQGLGPDLVDRLKTELEAKSEVMGLADKFRDARGFQFVLVSELEELAKLYESAWDGVTSLQDKLKDKALLAEATDCHLRPFKGRHKHTCAFCKVEDQLQKYEMKLFSFDVRNLEVQEVAGPANADPNQDRFNLMAGGPRGNWAASDHERALRILHSFLRSCSADDITLEEGTNFLEMLEQQRKEFKPLRAYWGAMRDRVAAMDELEMAMLRLRVKLPGEETDPASQPYIIEPHEIDQQRYSFLNDRLFAKNDLRRKLGQLVYLRNLNKAQYDLKDGYNPEPCPICVRPLGKQWTVLQCGHCFCNECMETMLKRVHIAGRQSPVKCAVCRMPTEGVDVSYVSVTLQQQDAAEQAAAEESIKVQGDHSTKIEAVVRTLKGIQLKEPGAKAIVFSTWSEVLELISKALTQNQIKFRNAGKQGGPKHFQAALMDFKHEADITALLLPVHSGSKGLNLIEATHVLLVEPILNPASEMQAVGRVHRIGQTKPTVVHRYLVHETIEEKLHSYLSTHIIRDGLNSVETDTGDMTFSDLKELFTSET